MEIRKEIPKRNRRGSVLQYPELLELQPGECAVFEVSTSQEVARVRAAVAYIRKKHDLALETAYYPVEHELKVWLPTIAKEE